MAQGKFPAFRRGDENRPKPHGLASTRLNGTHPIPAPSLREYRSLVDSCQWFTHSFLLALKFLSVYEHRSTLPQLRCAQQLPQRGSRDWLCHSSNRPETATLRAIFIAPTKTQMWVHFSIQRTTLPQSRPLGVPAPSGREPGGAVPCNQHKNTLKNSQIHERSFLWIH